MKPHPTVQAFRFFGISFSLIFATCLHASAQSGAILSWDPVADVSSAGYRVYAGTNSGVYTSVTTVGNVTEAFFGSLAAGLTYYFAIAACDTNSIESSFSTEISFTPAPSSPPTILGYSFAADAAILSSPFVSSNGSISQTVSTGGSDGGRAVYFFNVDDPDYYIISALVNASSPDGNSFCVNIDAEPMEPAAVWNIPVSSGFESNLVTWQDSPEPKVFPLSIGIHALIIRGRSAFTELGPISLTPYQPLSTPWQTEAIGSDVLPTEALYSNGVYTVLGAGALMGASDNFRFVYRPLTGDGEVRARIPSIQSQSVQGYAGIMIRENLTPESAYACFGITASGSFRWQKRGSTGGTTVSAVFRKSITIKAAWVKIVRKGNLFRAFVSGDGKKWKAVAARSITMAQTVYVGFVVASGSIDGAATATFDNAALLQ